MAQHVSLFRRDQGIAPARRTALFGEIKSRAVPDADHSRSADTLKVAAALGAAQARMERLFATA